MKNTKRAFLHRRDLPVFEYSPNGYAQLMAEIQNLEEQRPAVVEDLRKAREMGDLSENGYYKAARSKLSALDSRLKKFKFQKKYATIVRKTGNSVVGFGSKVVVEILGKKKNFEIVGNQESNPLEGTLSLHSPIGKALQGKKVGDKVIVSVPKGVLEFVILSIE